MPVDRQNNKNKEKPMLGFSDRVLLLLTFVTVPLIGIAQPSTPTCHNLFTPIFKQEPYLDVELSNLQKLCEQDVINENSEYWMCIHERMQQGPMNFQRLVLSAHVCDGQESGLAGPS